MRTTTDRAAGSRTARPHASAGHARREVVVAERRSGLLRGGPALRIGPSRWSAQALALSAIAIVLTAVGVTFVASASSVSALHATGDSWSVLQRQVVFVILGAFVITVTALIPYRAWWALGRLVWVVAFAFTVLTLTGVGVTKNGSSRWIGTSAFGFQPSELLKFGTIAMVAALFARNDHPHVIGDWHFLKTRLLPLLALSIGPVLAQPDMGTSVVIGLSAGVMIVAAGMPSRRVMQGGAIAAVGAVIYGSMGYRGDRIMAFLHPDRDVTGVGWHVAQSKMSFASGRILGVGIGASRAKWGFVPNAHTDFVFAIIGEELGLIGASVVLGLFGLVVLIGLSVVNNARDRFGALFAVGVITWVVSQAIINMGAVLGTLPVTGVPLPFVSYGGTSFLVIAAAFGVLINIARSAEPKALRLRRAGVVVNRATTGAAALAR